MKKHYLLCLLTAWVLTSSIKAQTSDPCNTMSSVDEIVACAVLQFTEATIYMDSIYQLQISKASPDYQLIIRENHNLWKIFAESTCSCETYPYSETTLATLTQYQCLTRVTNEYVNHLKLLQVGNMSQVP